MKVDGQITFDRDENCFIYHENEEKTKLIFQVNKPPTIKRCKNVPRWRLIPVTPKDKDSYGFTSEHENERAPNVNITELYFFVCQI